MASSSFTPVIESDYSTDSSISADENTSDSDHEAISRRYRNKMQKITNLTLPQIAYLLVPPVEKVYINRDMEGSHQQIWKDYFPENCTYPDDFFRRRYRMSHELFLRILKDVEAYNDYFVQTKDCCCHLGLSFIQKMTASIRVLAYGFAADHCDEYLKIGESTVIESLKHFFSLVIELYEGRYMRSPNEQDIAKLLQEGKNRGFLSMLGLLDCMHWEWKNCPTAWHSTYKGHCHKSTLILEAVASKNIWIWHAFFCMPSSHNDVNVLDHSPLFNSLIHGKMPSVNYEVNGRQYTSGYYLSDGIYPQWATLMQTIANPTTENEKLFAKNQEATRKDVEREFGILQIRWGITQGPVRYWKKEEICDITNTCIILHNMIIEDESDSNVEQWTPPSNETISIPTYARNPAILAAHISSRLSRIRNRGTNTMLRSDLIEHLWSKFGDKSMY